MTERSVDPALAGLHRVAIDPLTRVEGHGKVTLWLDDDRRVREARLHIVEFRGFERFIRGRPYWEAPVVVQRLCGICPVSHQLAASKALDPVAGAAAAPAAAVHWRRMLHAAQVLQSHALHFFHLSSPDLLFGFRAEAGRRHILAVAEAYPDVARQGIALRRFGQQVIEALSGKRIHGVLAVPGGINAAPSAETGRRLRDQALEMLPACRDAVALARRIYLEDPEQARFAHVPTTFLALTAPDGAFDLYDGRLNVMAADGRRLVEHWPAAEYGALIEERVAPWSYMKFPYLRAQGPVKGSYRVGPMARLNLCAYMPTTEAELARQQWLSEVADSAGEPAQALLATHWARMIELLHCAELLVAGLEETPRGPCRVQDDARQREGVGVIEAPRGTLIHHYQVDEEDLVSMANLIVSTTHNNQAMNDAVRAAADQVFDGSEVSEPLLNCIEVAVRAFDPCLSCATHALGRMPLQVSVIDATGRTLAEGGRGAPG